MEGYKSVGWGTGRLGTVTMHYHIGAETTQGHLVEPLMVFYKKDRGWLIEDVEQMQDLAIFKTEKEAVFAALSIMEEIYPGCQLVHGAGAPPTKLIEEWEREHRL